MKKTKFWIMIVGAFLLLAIPATLLAAGGPPENRGYGSTASSTGGQPEQPAVTGTLTDEQQATLTAFWLDEQKALATYQAIIAQFGEAAPFTAIAKAEQSHAAALERIFARYGITTPAVPTVDVPTLDTLADACAVSAQAEIDNAALYDTLGAQFTQTDILRVMERLSSASLNSHLPAFQDCADGEYEGIPGTGEPAAWGRGEQSQTAFQNSADGPTARGRGQNMTSPGEGYKGVGGPAGSGSGFPGRGQNMPIAGNSHADCPIGQR